MKPNNRFASLKSCPKRWLHWLAAAWLVALLSLSCAPTGGHSAPPTLKIGLVAPFEGLHRPLGYEALFGVKLALQERNREGVAGYRVELVALNDFDDPAEATRQARALMADPDVLGVVGHLSPATTAAALPIYRAAGAAVVVPWTVVAKTLDGSAGSVSVAADTATASAALDAFAQAQGWATVTTVTTPDQARTAPRSDAWLVAADPVAAGEIILALPPENLAMPLLGPVEAGSPQVVQVAEAAANGFIFASPGPAPADVPDGAGFIEAYQTLAGFPPGPRAVLAYDATHVLLDSLELALEKNGGRPLRADVSTPLVDIRRPGLSGVIAFEATGQRVNAPMWLYQITAGQYPGVLIAYP